VLASFRWQGDPRGDYKLTEKRKFRRVPLDAWVEVEAEGKLHRYQCRNISEGGMLLRGEDTLRENETFQMAFSLPDRSTPVTVAAIVQHVSPDAFMGVRFTNLSEDARAAIEGYVKGKPVQP